MKENLLTVAKIAMKFFFDINPPLTEHLIGQAAAQAFVIASGLVLIIRKEMKARLQRQQLPITDWT